MDLFASFKRGKIDKWYKQELKNLNENYFKSVNSASGNSQNDIQSSNNKSRELEAAVAALKSEYTKRLSDLGLKPRSDFSNN